jgi:hypothetical protein
MQAPSTHAQGHVEAVVHDKRNPSFIAHHLHTFSGNELIADAAVFLAELDGVGPTGNGTGSQLRVRKALLQTKIGDNVQTSNR